MFEHPGIGISELIRTIPTSSPDDMYNLLSQRTQAKVVQATLMSWTSALLQMAVCAEKFTDTTEDEFQEMLVSTDDTFGTWWGDVDHEPEIPESISPELAEGYAKTLKHLTEQLLIRIDMDKVHEEIAGFDRDLERFQSMQEDERLNILRALVEGI